MIVDAVQRLEDREKARDDNELRTAVRERRDEIFNDPASPVAGDPSGSVSIVEFFDYNCPYCRKAAQVLTSARAAEVGLRIVYKEFPILGAGSTFAAKAALAAQRQGKYLQFHQALMAHTGSLAEASTLQVARDVGLDAARLKQDIEDPEIARAIERNLNLGNELRITGTPSWVIGEDIVRGLVDWPTLQNLVAKQRERPTGAP